MRSKDLDNMLKTAFAEDDIHLSTTPMTQNKPLVSIPAENL